MQPLQAEQVTCVGWLLGLHEDLCILTMEKLLQEAILQVSSSPIPTPCLALMYKSIWDGSKKLDWEKEKAKNFSRMDARDCTLCMLMWRLLWLSG